MEKGSALGYIIDASNRRVLLTYRWQPVTIMEWEAAMEEVFKSDLYQHGFDFLLDRTAIAKASTTAFIKSLVSYIDRHWRTKGEARWAFVTHDIAAFGTGRMAEQLSDFPGSIRIFKSVEEAVAWLDKKPHSAS